MHRISLWSRVKALVRAIDTVPGTPADDLGCFAALASLGVVGYVLLVLA